MSNLFYLPRVHSTPGAKLYFRATGTSTPQNTYQDIDLSTAHANPVVADADGYFDPIYLDPALPDYRVIHTDGSDAGDDYTQEVLLEPILDDVPASATTTPSQRIKGTAPILIWEETDQTSGNQKWFARANGNQLDIGPLDGAESSFTTAISIARDGGVTISDLTAGSNIATVESGSFTGTQTGYSSDLTPTIQWRKSGTIVSLSCNAGSVGTSNGTGLTLAGIPVGIRPLQSMTYINRLTDNGAVGLGVAIVGTNGTITFGNGITGSTFTGSGSKGLPGGWSLIYEAG